MYIRLPWTRAHHDRRAMAATNTLVHHAAMAKVAEWLGESDVATTRRYDQRQSRLEESLTAQCSMARRSTARRSPREASMDRVPAYPRYDWWEDVPPHLTTRTTLNRLGLRPAPGQLPINARGSSWSHGVARAQRSCTGDASQRRGPGAALTLATSSGTTPVRSHGAGGRRHALQ